jgi:hypothetical protein
MMDLKVSEQARQYLSAKGGAVYLWQGRRTGLC